MGTMRPLAVALLGLALASPIAALAEREDCSPAEVPIAVETPPRAQGMRIGLALGSGSMHGLAHVGVLEAIEEARLDVRVVSGTSVGALVGALWASGLTARQIRALADAGGGDFAPPSTWQVLFGGGGVRPEFTSPLAAAPIERWPKRFAAVATNLDNGHRRLLLAGDGVKAVEASTAVPVFSRSVTIGGERLGDGALVEPVPIAAARDLGADFVIAIDVAYRPYEESASGITGLAFQSMHILVNSLAQAQLRDADFAIRLDVHRRLADCGAEAVVAAGRNAVRQSWPQLVRAIEARARERATP
jgi:NTE family protein